MAGNSELPALSRQFLYDSTIKDQQFSVLSNNKTLSRTLVKLEDINNVFSITLGSLLTNVTNIAPKLTDFDFGEDEFKHDVNLNDYLYEIIFGDGDVDALAINIIRICKTFSMKLASVSNEGHYIYHGDPSLFEYDEFIHHAMKTLELLGKILYFDAKVTDEDMRNAQHRLICMWHKNHYDRIIVHWNNAYQKTRGMAPIRITLKHIDEYVSTKIPDLFSWLVDGNSSFGGQINHIKTLLCGFYAARFGSPSVSLNRTITGMTSYTLPNVRPRLVTDRYKTNTIGRAWVVCELIICFFRKYDPYDNTSNLLVKDKILGTDTNDEIGRSGMGTMRSICDRKIVVGKKATYMPDVHYSDTENVYERPRTNKPKLPMRNQPTTSKTDTGEDTD
nr:tubule protein [Fijivirus sp.]